MALKRFALYGAATLTALTLASCGGGGESDDADPTTAPAASSSVAPGSVNPSEWMSTDDMVDAMSRIDGCDDVRPASEDHTVLCDGETSTYMLTIDRDDDTARTAHALSAAQSNTDGQIATIYGDWWAISATDFLHADESIMRVNGALSGLQKVRLSTDS